MTYNHSKGNLIPIKTKNKQNKGFTLIELIIVIAIIAILAAAVLVAIDPARRLHESRNARRWSDIENIIDAVIKYQTDNEGEHYTTVESLSDDVYYTIGTCIGGGNSGCTAQTTQTACVNLTDIGSNYMAKIPIDPKDGTESQTDYYLMKDENGAITVGACDPESEGPGGNGATPDIESSR